LCQTRNKNAAEPDSVAFLFSSRLHCALVQVPGKVSPKSEMTNLNIDHLPSGFVYLFGNIGAGNRELTGSISTVICRSASVDFPNPC
jgi:hypothetical protein